MNIFCFSISECHLQEKGSTEAAWLNYKFEMSVMIRKIKTSNSSGFSFVELMVVIGIVGILSAIAIPAFLSRLPGMRLRAETRELYSDLQKVKLEAIKRNSCVCVDFTATGYKGFIDNESGAATRACNRIMDADDTDTDTNGEQYFFSGDFQERGVLLEEITSNFSRPTASDAIAPTESIIGSVCYNSQGMICKSQAGHITLANDNLKGTVNIRPAGGLQIEMSDE